MAGYSRCSRYIATLRAIRTSAGTAVKVQLIRYRCVYLRCPEVDVVPSGRHRSVASTMLCTWTSRGAWPTSRRASVGSPLLVRRKWNVLRSSHSYDC